MAEDPHELARFVDAQAADYDQALAEIRAGAEAIPLDLVRFPADRRAGVQLDVQTVRYQERGRSQGLPGSSGPRETAGRDLEAALAVEGKSAYDIFGSPDDMKLKSCATLFANVSPPDSVFQRWLDKYFKGERDGKTLKLIGSE